MACNAWIALVLIAAVIILIAIFMGGNNQEGFFDGTGITVSWNPPANANSNTRYQWFACNPTANAQCGPNGCPTDATGSASCPITSSTSASINDAVYPNSGLDFGQNISFSVRSLDISQTPPLTSAWTTITINANSPNTGGLTITSSPASGSSTVNNPPAPGDTILNLSASVNANLGGLPSTVPNATVQITRGPSTWAWNAGGISIRSTTGNPTVYNITADTTSTASIWTNGPASGVPGPLQAGDVINFFILVTTNTSSSTQQGNLGFYGQQNVTVTAPVVQPPGAPTGITYTFG